MSSDSLNTFLPTTSFQLYTKNNYLEKNIEFQAFMLILSSLRGRSSQKKQSSTVILNY